MILKIYLWGLIPGFIMAVLSLYCYTFGERLDQDRAWWRTWRRVRNVLFPATWLWRNGVNNDPQHYTSPISALLGIKPEDWNIFAILWYLFLTTIIWPLRVIWVASFILLSSITAVGSMFSMPHSQGSPLLK